MTTVKAKNVFNIALDDNFDECQKFVKLMFEDKKFNRSINMSGVNSINWARIVVQIVYYFFSYFKVEKKGENVNFFVPSGNFGDIYAGYVAKKMGLPINKLIIATNSNDILKRVLKTGVYKPSKVKHTISPSMDIQIASNFERLIFDTLSQDSSKTLNLMTKLKKKGRFKISKKEIKKISKNFYSISLSEKETKSAIKKFYKDFKILIDPHTAIAVGAVNKVRLNGKNIILSTAHPAKFSNTVKTETGKKPKLPNSLKGILIKKEKYEIFPNNLKKLKKYILKNK